MSEKAANLFMYIDDGLIKSLGVVGHNFDGNDEEIAAYLQVNVETDSLKAERFPLPVSSIKIWLGVDAENGLPYEMFSYLHRTGKAMLLFEIPLKAIGAPEQPFVCYTPVVDGKPSWGARAHINPLICPTLVTEQFGGVVKQIDWIAKYMTAEGLNIHDLLADDFTKAIKLLYAHHHYVSAFKLIVSFVDTIAFLDLGDKQGNFEAWLSKYAKLASVGVVPSELWEFRNAILHMTSPLSRKVISGKIPSLQFHVDPENKKVVIDNESGTKLFSFLALYDAIIEGVEVWVKSYSGDLPRQIELIKRYDTIISEGRISFGHW